MALLGLAGAVKPSQQNLLDNEEIEKPTGQNTEQNNQSIKWQRWLGLLKNTLPLNHKCSFFLSKTIMIIFYLNPSLDCLSLILWSIQHDYRSKGLRSSGNRIKGITIVKAKNF